MAWSFNQVVIMGNLTRDPELRTTGSGQSVCSFSVAINRRIKDQATDEWKDSPTFVDVVAWAELGERVSQYCQKGRPVLVNGRLQSSSWEQDGQKRSKLEVIAREVIFLGGASNDDQAGSPPAPATGSGDAKADVKKPTSKSTSKQEKATNDIPEGEIDLSDIPF